MAKLQIWVNFKSEKQMWIIAKELWYKKLVQDMETPNKQVEFEPKQKIDENWNLLFNKDWKPIMQKNVEIVPNYLPLSNETAEEFLEQYFKKEIKQIARNVLIRIKEQEIAEEKKAILIPLSQEGDKETIIKVIGKCGIEDETDQKSIAAAMIQKYKTTETETKGM